MIFDYTRPHHYKVLLCVPYVVVYITFTPRKQPIRLETKTEFHHRVTLTDFESRHTVSSKSCAFPWRGGLRRLQKEQFVRPPERLVSSRCYFSVSRTQFSFC